MPFNRPEPPPAWDDKYLNQQVSSLSRPMDLFPVNKGPGADPLAGDWSYDSAVDLFSLNPADMDQNSFDFADGLANTDSKGLFMDSFSSSTAINGFTMPTAEDTVSLSSDLDSDDQSWPNTIPQPHNLKTEQTPNNNPSTPLPSSSTSTAFSARWSSSPEIKPEEYLAARLPTTTINPTTPILSSTRTPRITRKARSLSQDSARSNTTHPSQSQNQGADPTTRNAAKRAAHNIIEKRYRTNMNAKFLALEQAIAPSGNGVRKPQSRGGAGSLKKSEILSNALAYIEGVQQENLALKKEVALLRGERGLVGGGWRGAKSRG